MTPDSKCFKGTAENGLDEQALVEEFAETITMTTQDVTSELRDLFAKIKDPKRHDEVPNHIEQVTKDQVQLLSRTDRNLLKCWLCINEERLTPKLVGLRGAGDIETLSIPIKKLPTADERQERVRHIFRELLLLSNSARHDEDPTAAANYRKAASLLTETLGDEGSHMKEAVGLSMTTTTSKPTASGEPANKPGTVSIAFSEEMVASWAKLMEDKKGPLKITAIVEGVNGINRANNESSKSCQANIGNKIPKRNTHLEAAPCYPRNKKRRFSNESVDDDEEWLP